MFFVKSTWLLTKAGLRVRSIMFHITTIQKVNLEEKLTPRMTLCFRRLAAEN